LLRRCSATLLLLRTDDSFSSPDPHGNLFSSIVVLKRSHRSDGRKVRQ
jgi:hypothetical protein